MNPFNNLRMELKEALTNMWNRISARIEAIEEGGGIPATQKGAAGGVAELDSGGKVPASQLPAYVDDVLEYATNNDFPATGESGKIYVATDTNLTYRWTGSNYVEIAGGLALGETASTAYRGDRGKYAYDHAAAHGSAFASGLYLIQTNAEGHVIGATPVTESDLAGIAVTGVKGIADSSYRKGNVSLTAGDVNALSKGNYGNINYLIRYISGTDISQANNGITDNKDHSGTIIGANDSAGSSHSVTDISVDILKTGETCLTFVLRNGAGSSAVAFGGRAELKKDGTVAVFFSHPEAIKTALEAKGIQTPVADPAASGSAVAFIDSITQDAQGVITPTKKTVPNATQSDPGLMSAADKAKLDGLDNLGFYIDNDGYICQRIGSDT